MAAGAARIGLTAGAWCVPDATSHSAPRQVRPLVRLEWASSQGIAQLWAHRGQGERSMLTELQSLSERRYQAWLEKDVTTVECLMAEDYIYVGPNGLVLDRQAILAVIGSPSYRLDHGTRTDVVVRCLDMRRPLCGIAGRGQGRLRALHSPMTIGVSWSGRNRVRDGGSCWINAPAAASRGRGAPGLAKPWHLRRPRLSSAEQRQGLKPVAISPRPRWVLWESHGRCLTPGTLRMTSTATAF